MSELARRATELVDSSSADDVGCPACGSNRPQPGHTRQPRPDRSQLPSVRPVSAARYLGLVFLLPLLSATLLWAGVVTSRDPGWAATAVSLMLISFVAQFVLLYKAWAAVQDGYAQTTPGRAVGFLFIPIYSVFWMFIAIGSWPQNYNLFADRHDIRGFRASPELFVAWSIALVISSLGRFLFPSLLWLGGLAALIITPLALVQLCRGINGVARAAADRAVPTARALK